MPLLDRRQELAALDDLLAATRGGMSSALILHGDAGVGLTSLLDYAAESATGMHVARATGVEAELKLAYSGLHQLIAPMLDRIERLPAPQRGALAGAFGLVGGDSPDRLLVGLAVLTLLSEVAGEQPLLCIVDDAQWLDQASAEALAFAARRVYADYIGLIFAVREPTHVRSPLTGLPELRVGGLPYDEARDLLTGAVGGTLDPRVRDSLVTECDGNPFALLSLAEELTPAQLAGLTALTQPLPLGEEVVDRFLRTVRDLPSETQTLMLLAAADPDVDADLFWRAAASIDVSADAAEPAAAERLFRVNEKVKFRHPLLRSAVYAAAGRKERRRVHRALAEATDPELEPDRRAWHRASAAVGVDEELAAEMERAAERAQARGGLASTATFLERAARLTPDPARRGQRLIAAAELELLGGAPGRATALLAEASVLALDPLGRAEALRIRGAIALALGQGADSSRLLLQAATALEPLDVPRARDAYLEALEAAMYSGRLGGGATIREAATAARAARAGGDPQRPSDLLLDGYAATFTTGPPEALPNLRRAVESLRSADDPRWFALGCLAAVEIWDDQALHALANRQVQLAREQGALPTLALALDQQAGMDDVLAGLFDLARGRFEEAREISAATGDPRLVDHVGPGQVIVAAWCGPADAARRLADAAMQEAIAHALGRYVNFAQYALAVLEVGLGRYEEALVAARAACEDEYMCIVNYALPEFVEAAVRSGQAELAASAEVRLAERTLTGGTDWGLGVLARSRALLADGAEAEALYAEGIERLHRTRAVPQLARAHLVYGEWLRRERRRRDARAELATAYDLFASMGAQPFAERARLELAATGQKARKRSLPASTSQLTAQESNIAGLVAGGSSNADIASQLFISPRTVEYHLHKIFRKLEITSRTQLAREILETR